MKTFVLVAVACGLIVGLCPVALAEAPTTRTLTHVASQSVVAAQTGAGLRTGFAFRHGEVVVGSTGAGSVRLIAVSGMTAVVTPSAHNAALVIASLSALNLKSLTSSQKSSRHGSRAYVLGPPLGYGGQNIRSVTLRYHGKTASGGSRVSGHLPAAFQGAPVVTASGALLGAVATVDPHSWSFIDVSRLDALARQVKPIRATGFPLIPVAAGVAFALLLLGAAFLIVRRRRGGPRESFMVTRRFDMPSDAGAIMEDRPTQPTVRRRESAETTAEEDDFEVVVKSQADDQ